MRARRLAGAALALLGLSGSGTAATVPEVVASIAPLHSLAAGVMSGLGEPVLIVRGYRSPHTYQLKPSDARALEDADVVFWIGAGLETFLVRAIESISADAQVVELVTAPGLRLLPTRAGGVWDPHDDQRATSEAVPAAEVDMHLWLDVGNARQLVEIMADTLAKVDPANASKYRANRDAFIERLDALDRTIERRLRPVADVPYVVFHDAYQYLERHYRLNAVGSVAVSPQRQPSAKRLKEIRDEIEALGVRCVFGAPQFESALVNTVVEGTGASIGTLDPQGADLAPGVDAYFELMHRNARALVSCLSR